MCGVCQTRAVRRSEPAAGRARGGCDARRCADQGITPEELDGREVTAKITPVTDAELKAEWQAWKSAYGDDFEKVRAHVAESVQNDKKQALEKAFDERLRKGHEIRLRLGGDVYTAHGMRAAIEKEIRRSPSSTDRARR